MDYVMARRRDCQHFTGVALRSPRHHDTDHRAVVAMLRGWKRHRLMAYGRWRQCNPLQLTFGPQGELKTVFEQLKRDVEKPAPREQQHNKWILPAKWALINMWPMLRRQGRLCQAGFRRMKRRILRSLKEYRAARTERVAEDIESELMGGDVKEAFHHLKGWYRDASNTTSCPCFLTLEKQMEDREKLYRAHPPEG